MPQSLEQLLKHINVNQLLNDRTYCQQAVLTPLTTLLNRSVDTQITQQYLSLIQQYQLFNTLNLIKFARLELSDCFRVAFHNQMNIQLTMNISPQQNYRVAQNEQDFQDGLYKIAYRTFTNLPVGVQKPLDTKFDVLANVDFNLAILPLSPKVSQSGITVDFAEIHHQLTKHFQKNEFNMFKYKMNPTIKKQVRSYIQTTPNMEFKEWLQLWWVWDFMLNHCQHVSVQWFKHHQLAPFDNRLGQLLMQRDVLTKQQFNRIKDVK